MPKETFLRLDDEKQERVMRSAIEEFQENGFENAKIGNIAKKAGVAKGSIYQYFEDKKAFFLYAIRWSLEYFIQNINQPGPLQDLDVFEYLFSGGRQRFELIKNEPVLVKFAQDCFSGKLDGLTKEINQEVSRVGDANIYKMIAIGKNKGTIRQDIDDDLLVLFYKGVTEKMDELVLSMINEFGNDLNEAQYQKLEGKTRSILKLIRTGMGS